MNICDYIEKFGDKSFDERPFNEVDSLIFAELAYLNYERFLNWDKPEKTLKDLEEHAPELVEHTYFPKSNTHLLTGAAASERFKNVKVGWFGGCYDEERVVQFAAVTFKLENGDAVVAFRGTDVSIVGWKEDFNMAFLSEIPAQGLSVEYLNKVAAEESGKLYLCGHSKGGNLAVYSAVFSNPEIRERIVGIYNHDGPGFNEQIFTKPEYIELSDRMCKIVPHNSLIGILLEHTNDYKVVLCRSVSIGQHNPFMWEVADENSFEEKLRLTVDSRVNEEALYNLVNAMNDEERQIFVKGLFDVIEGSGAKFLYELRDDPFKRLGGMTKAFFALTGEEKKLMALGGMKFIKMWFKSIINLKDIG